eukprot:10731103-Karenia_brevis.AAC.1
MDAKYGTNGWLPMQRFALWQDNHTAWRVIDNGLSSGHNSTAYSTETIHTTCTDIGLAILDCFARLNNGVAGLDVLMGTQDMKS